MLSSCTRPLARVLGSQSVRRAPKTPVSASNTYKGSRTSSVVPTTTSRYYAGHAHHEEPVKPYKRTVLSPQPADGAKSAEELEREVKGIEGWIFGRKVTYLDPLAPINDSEEVKSSNGWIFNKKPLENGKSREWEDWEPITYIGTAICIGIVVVGLWSRPDIMIQHWALEEARERKVMKERRELALKEQQNAQQPL